MLDQNIMEARGKVLALACSPSKGFNSDNMLEAFLDGVKKVKEIQIEKIYLNDLKIDNYSFLNRIPDPVKDADLLQLIEKIMSCNGLVIATPTFNFGVPAALKNLLDRLSYKALNPKKINWMGQPTGTLRHVKGFYLVSCGTSWILQKLAWGLFPAFWLRVVFWYFGGRTLGSLYGAGLNARNLAKDKPKLLSSCQQAGEKYAKKLLKS